MRLEYISRIKDGLKRYKTISTKKTTSRVLDGSYNSIYKGRSMNFDELREYVPGDDVKDIDWIEHMIPVAEENFASRPEGSRIDFRTGDADKVLDRMIEEQKSGSTEPFDFVFIDAGKSHYREFFDRAEQLTRPGSIIVCDNILMHGWTVDRSYEGARRHRTNVKYMRMFIDYINEIGYSNIIKIEKELTKYALAQLKKLKFVTLYCTSDAEKHSSVISFNINGVHPHDVASILDKHNVYIRSGNHCAQPLLRYLGIDSTCRVSLSIYNTKEDIDKLILALKKVYEIFKKYIKV